MHTMHLLPDVIIQANLELKTRPKPVLGSLPLAFALPTLAHLAIGKLMTQKLGCFKLTANIILMSSMKI
jgi:hypothetical protein